MLLPILWVKKQPQKWGYQPRFSPNSYSWHLAQLGFFNLNPFPDPPAALYLSFLVPALGLSSIMLLSSVLSWWVIPSSSDRQLHLLSEDANSQIPALHLTWSLNFFCGIRDWTQGYCIHAGQSATTEIHPQILLFWDRISYQVAQIGLQSSCLSPQSSWDYRDTSLWGHSNISLLIHISSFTFCSDH